MTTYSSFQKESKYAHLKSELPLLEALRPGNYAILCTLEEKHLAWAIVLANYAATLGGPILFTQWPDENEISTIDRLLGRLDKLSYLAVLDMPGGADAVKQQSAEIKKALSALLGKLIINEVNVLEKFKPQFLGIATPLAHWPMELAGSPSLSLCYAIGRLSGPTLTATAEIVARAALSEDVNRKPWLNALLLCASNSNNELRLSNTVSEIETTRKALEKISFIRTNVIVDRADDVNLVQQQIQDAELFHFAGHARLSLGGANDIEMVLTGGTLASSDLPYHLNGQPIVFSNACSSGKGKTNVSQTVQGLAAQFLQKGAVNYIGNLWPVLDRTAAKVANQFYPKICNGMSIGQALMEVKRNLAQEDSSSWEAIVLYGCPRNVLSSQSTITEERN